MQAERTWEAAGGAGAACIGQEPGPHKQSKYSLWTHTWSWCVFWYVCIRSALVCVISRCHVTQGGCVCWESEQISCSDQYGVNLNRPLSGLHPPPHKKTAAFVITYIYFDMKFFPFWPPQSAGWAHVRSYNLPGLNGAFKRWRYIDSDSLQNVWTQGSWM